MHTADDAVAKHTKKKKDPRIVSNEFMYFCDSLRLRYSWSPRTSLVGTQASNIYFSLSESHVFNTKISWFYLSGIAQHKKTYIRVGIDSQTQI